MRAHLQRTREFLFSPRAWKARAVFWIGAGVVGATAVAFAEASERAHLLLKKLVAFSPYAPLVVAPAGFVAVAWITRRWFRGAEGSGIPQSIVALESGRTDVRDALLSLRVAAGKMALTLVGLLCGASIGREGPTVHIGAAIMYSLGRFAHFPAHVLDRGLILAGGSAGIAAAFNTPLAGIVFAIEEMSRSFEERNSGTMLTAVLLAGFTALAIQGYYSYFGRTEAFIPPLQAWLPVVACGVLGGLLGGLFSTGIIWGGRALRPLMSRWPLWVAAGCGLLVGLMGLASGGVTYGTGYEEARGLVTGAAGAAPEFAFLKLGATLASYWSGIPGGIFAPSLATGAGFGALLVPWFDAPAGAIVVLGMVGYFAGVVQTPITAFVIVMEMTLGTQLTLPLMATAFIGSGTSKLVCPTPIYRALARNFRPDRVLVPAGGRTTGEGRRP